MTANHPPRKAPERVVDLEAARHRQGAKADHVVTLLNIRVTDVRVTDDPFGPAFWQLGPDDHDRFRRALADLAAEYAYPLDREPEITKELLRLLPAGILLRIARLPAPDGNDRSPATQVPYRLFRYELERSFGVLCQAHDHAARLGCSLKTLNRACQRATGHTAKQLIDARVTLEAKRLLAHTGLPSPPSATVSASPSRPTSASSSPATGQTPGAFRDTQSRRTELTVRPSVTRPAARARARRRPHRPRCPCPAVRRA